jgi:hypothetical protein
MVYVFGSQKNWCSLRVSPRYGCLTEILCSDAGWLMLHGQMMNVAMVWYVRVLLVLVDAALPVVERVMPGDEKSFTKNSTLIFEFQFHLG